MPSRISGACNGCRTKKQKCSGDRDGCAQCMAAGIVCTWPEQRKRGPAKGYIEGLEHRLHEAETLLLQLLPIVSPEQLSAATATLVASASMRDSPEHATGRSSPPVLNKKTGIDYWETFPLDSVENIRRWQADCAIQSQFRDDVVSTSRGASRPSSIDLTREAIAPAQHRKQSSMNQQPFRAMSTESYSRSNHHTPTSQPEYMSAQVQNSVQAQQPQPQQWTNSVSVKNDHTSNYMQTGYAGPSDHQWQQQQQQQQPHQQQPQNAYQQRQQQNQMQMQMEIDSGFFPSDMKRNLFW